jgi:hypothetical protein
MGRAGRGAVGELRREHFVRRVPIKELARRYGIDRNTVRRALRSDRPPRYESTPRRSKLDPFKDEIDRLVRGDPKLTGVRVGELIEPLGVDGQKTIVDDYLREFRPLFRHRRSYQLTLYLPGEICQFDLCEPSVPIPFGHGRSRRGFVVVACLSYSGASAGALVFSKQAPDLLWGMGRCLWSLGALPGPARLGPRGRPAAGDARPTDVYAAMCGQLKLDLHFCPAADPERRESSSACRATWRRTSSPGAVRERARLSAPARRLVRAGQRPHAQDVPCPPVERLVDKRAAMRPLPQRSPDTDRRFVTKVAPDPYLRFETNDYSPDPRLVGRRVEVRISQRELVALSLDSVDLVARHERRFALRRTITALEHARALRQRRCEPEAEPVVEQRPLEHYDPLIA